MSVGTATERRPAARRRHLAGGAAVFLLAIVGALYAWAIWVKLESPHKTDFARLHLSAQHLLAGEDIYRPVPWSSFGGPAVDPVSGRLSAHANLNPPVQTVLFAPLALLALPVAYIVWSVLSLASLALSAAILARCYGDRHASGLRYLLFTLLLLAYFPSWIAVALGQVSHFLLLLLLAAWIWGRDRRECPAGLAMGVAIALKPFTGLFLVLFLFLGRWRLSLWTIGTSAAAALLALAVVGPQAYVRYLEVLGEIDWYGASWNASIMGIATRIFGGSLSAPLIDAPQVAPWLQFAAFTLVLAALLWLARARQAVTPAQRFDMGCAVVLPTMLLLSPLGWLYYFPFLVVPLLTLFELSRNRPWRRHYRVLGVGAWLMSTVPNFLVPPAEMGEIGRIFGYPLFLSGALLLFTATLLAMFRLLEPSGAAVAASSVARPGAAGPASGA